MARRQRQQCLRATILTLPLVLILLVLLLHRHALYLPPLQTEAHCVDRSIPRQVAEGLLTPHPPDSRVHALAGLWRNLTDTFHTNAPVPRRRLRPVFYPVEDSLKFTQLQADKILDITPRQALLTRQAHQRVLDTLPDYSTVSDHFNGRGIVILAGGRYVHVVTTTISILRLEHGCLLPIEIWLGNDRPPDPVWLDDMVRLGVSVRSIADYAPLGALADWFNPFRWVGNARPWSQYQWKVMALLFSSFQEVLFLDADCVPVRDSSALFETEAYQSSGAVIWPDYFESVAPSWLPHLVGVSDRPSDKWWHSRTAEAGEMLWDKRRHWKSLLLACYYNHHGANFWYTASIGNGPGWGDKDTFLLALRVTGEHHVQVAGTPQSVEAMDGIGALNRQYHPDNTTTVALLHAAGGMKWSLDEFLNVRHRSRDPLAFVKSFFWAKSDTLHDLLQRGGRIFKEYPEIEVDPEVLMWRGLEHVACGSRALGSERACGWVRRKMTGSLGPEATARGSVHSCPWRGRGEGERAPEWMLG